MTQLTSVSLASNQLTPNVPLSLNELECMARKGTAVWCVDSEGIDCGVLSMREDWWNNGQESPYICLPNEEGGMNQYSVEFMMELGAAFYRNKPKGGKHETADNG